MIRAWSALFSFPSSFSLVPSTMFLWSSLAGVNGHPVCKLSSSVEKHRKAAAAMPWISLDARSVPPNIVVLEA